MPLYTSIPPAEGRRQLIKLRFTVVRAAGLLIFALAGCMLGLLLLDTSNDPVDTRLFRALWNSANTISTLGDLDSLNDRQQTFMIGAMFTLVILGGYAISSLTGILSGNAIQAYREYRRVAKTLAGLTGHYVVAGYGVYGRRVAFQLQQQGRDVVVIEFDETLARRASDMGFLTILLVAGRDEAFATARLTSAAALLVTIHDADRKLALTMIARGICPELPIVVADDSDADQSWLPHAGASRVILVDQLVAQALVDELAKVPATS